MIALSSVTCITRSANTGLIGEPIAHPKICSLLATFIFEVVANVANRHFRTSVSFWSCCSLSLAMLSAKSIISSLAVEYCMRTCAKSELF